MRNTNRWRQPALIFTLLTAAIVGLSLTGCASTKVTPDPAPNPGSLPTTATVHGHALDPDGTPVAGVKVALCNTTNCNATAKIATTGSDGTYSIRLPFGTYLEVCGGAATCQIAGSPPKESVKFALARSGAVIDLITESKADPDSEPQPQPQKSTSDTMSGVVYDSGGHPVSGIAVEFRMTACKSCEPQPNTTSDGTGHYSIELNDGSYSAECDVENTDYECGPRGGDGDPFPVTMPTSNHLNFVVCPYQQYPACLGSSAVPTN